MNPRHYIMAQKILETSNELVQVGHCFLLRSMQGNVFCLVLTMSEALPVLKLQDYCEIHAPHRK